MTTHTRTGPPPLEAEGLRGRDGEQSRARYPDDEGFVERDGQRLFYEVYGDGEETLFLTQPWLVHSRHWKMQIHYLARHFRVLSMDGLGYGRSDRCRDPRRYGAAESARDCLAVMDATGTERAVIVSLSRSAQYTLELARLAPERVTGSVFIAPMFPYSPSHWSVLIHPLTLAFSRAFQLPTSVHRWWLRMFPAYWREGYPEFANWFISRCLPEPHSTKGIEDGVRWVLETDPETLSATVYGHVHRKRRILRELAQNLDCPVLVISGERDMITPHRDARALARLSDARLEVVRGGGHVPHLREPVQVNLALREFVDRSFRRDPTVYRSSDGRPRALFVSAPIGLGHAQRDVAVARELRKLVPDLQVDWLAQDPVTRVLEAEGEHIHPASEHLASESKHWESECAEHDLHAFEAMRRMDEILAANFMLFRDVVADTRYDLWVADEMWDIDYYLHENPNEKRAPYAWMTDFVGFVPMSDGGEREAFLAADYNAQMVEHIAAHPTLRDRAIYIGDPEDLIREPLGPDLPTVRDWTQANFDCAGYITGFDPAQFADRHALRAELGYGEDEQVCIVTVGGTNVGIDLLRRVVAAAPLARERVGNLRMIVVAGPRIDRHALDAPDGVEVLPYVHHLYRNLAACDLAVVQGGLSTSMELTANRRPFLSFPLKHHFEQQVHVRHRVQRYGAARFMDYDSETPETIADAIAADIGRDVHCRDVETDGARLAAQHIAELLN
jgi:pimeloyl-ACP methyl ester carboxylesterase/UDP-N-acetylglucosamine:LPS N-acetylglucosamine transferase